MRILWQDSCPTTDTHSFYFTAEKGHLSQKIKKTSQTYQIASASEDVFERPLEFLIAWRMLL